jgi:hypothetical protein
MAPLQQRLGGNLVLASLLAVLSYVPFHYIAKFSLLVCAFLFILDPIPPVTRLLAIASIFAVSGLSRLHIKYIHNQDEVTEDNKKQEQ